MPHTFTESVSDEIRAEIARRRINQSQLAGALALTQTAVSNRLNGKVAWDVNELAVVAQFLGVPVAALIPKQAS